MTTLLPRTTPRMRNIAMEFLAFQDGDKVGAAMETQVAIIVDKITNKVYEKDEELPDSPECKALVKVIFERFGMKMDFHCDDIIAAIIPFYSNRNHVFLHEFLRGNVSLRDQQKILNQSASQKGVVNIEKAYVSGIFSEYEHELYINFRELIKAGMSAPEIVAVILHELGHAFNACEYSDRMETTNQVLADAFREMTKRNDKRDMVYIYRELKKVNKEVTEAEIDTIVNGNKVIAGYTWFKVCVGVVQEQLSNPAYSRTAFESGSDIFANRFGYGRQLVSALAKLHAQWPLSSSTPSQSWILFTFSVLSFVIGIMSIMAAFFASHIVAVIYMSFVFGMTLRLSGDDKRDMTYDELRQRYARVRADMVEFLKRSKIKPEKMRDVVDGLKNLDTLIEATAHEKNIYTMVANVIFSDARAANHAIKEQQLLEKLSFNDLFVRSAELKMAADEVA